MGRWGGRSLKPITLPRPKHRPAQDDDDEEEDEDNNEDEDEESAQTILTSLSKLREGEMKTMLMPLIFNLGMLMIVTLTMMNLVTMTMVMTMTVTIMMMFNRQTSLPHHLLCSRRT